MSNRKEIIHLLFLTIAIIVRIDNVLSTVLFTGQPFLFLVARKTVFFYKEIILIYLNVLIE